MSNERLPQAVWSGTFTLFGVVLHCHVLDNGQRVIDGADLNALFDAMGNHGTEADPAELAKFATWQQGGS